MDLSILIPSRNEMFLAKTIENILENIRADTEIIAVCDGEWADPPIEDHPKVKLIYHSESIGQRAAVNEAANLSQAKFVMKLDAHCSVDKGFDVKLMKDCEYDWTVIPRMYNLHAFDWKCKKCGNQTYQGADPIKCEKCDNTKDFEKVIIWERRKSRRSDFARFDNNMKFQYWRAYGKRPEGKKDITDTMSSIGACFFMHRERFFDLGGLDEEHGSWGQFGTEIACKSQLSGGRHMVNKKTWFAHMFRTGKGFSFPYKQSGRQVQNARKYSNEMWKGNKWPKAKHDLQWLIDKYAPVPDWEEETKVILKEAKAKIQVAKQTSLTKEVIFNKNKLTKGLIYYTDNRCEERIMQVCKNQLKRICKNWPIISVSHFPIDFGDNIVMNLPRKSASIYKQILAGLQASKVDIVFLIEHDILYHPSHFDFMPPEENQIYYNLNRWAVDAQNGQALHYISWCNSHVVVYRETLLNYLTEFVALVEKEGYSRKRMGHAIGKRQYRGVKRYKVKTFKSEYPNVDIRHSNNFTPNRFKKEQFQHNLEEWKLADEIPGWGKTKGRFDEFLYEVAK